jgi:hypothetical protein
MPFAGSDARISIGIGEIGYFKDSIPVSDGEAFHNSGRAFDSLSRSSRMVVVTPMEVVNDELRTECVLADHIVSRMTDKQSRVAYRYLIGTGTQRDLAAELNMSPQLVSRLLSYGGGVMKDFVHRFEKLVKDHVL